VVSILRAGGVADVIVVVAPGDEAVAAEIQSLTPPPRTVENPDVDRGQLSSLLVGLNVADRPGVRGLLVMPVDIPLVRVDTVEAVLRTFATASVPIVRAAHRGRHGHPVVFGRSVFGELRAADPALGARAVIRAHAASTLDVEVDDPGVLRDIDDPATYEAVFGAKP
jgi:molybdenum cofactor cytidylyltransferase